MARIYTGKLISELRQRKQWQQEKLRDELSCYAPELYRIEKGEQLPRTDSLKVVMDALSAPMDELICPHLDGQPLDAYVLRYRLIQALDSGDLHMAEELFGELSNLEGFGGAINRQFFLSQQARLMELQEKQADDIIPLVAEALEQTFDGFDGSSPGSKVLIFEEPELFHTLSRLYAQKGRLAEAIKMLEDTYSGLRRLPIGERERDRRVLPMLHSLADFHMQNGDYAAALEACETGLDVSAMRCLGKDTPELLLLKMEVLLKLGRTEQCGRLLIMAFAGFMLLGEKEKALDVLAKTQSEHEATYELRGMEKLDIAPSQRLPYAHGGVTAGKTVGDMIRIMREETGLSLKELSQGICSTANLGKIEKNEVQGHMHYLEPILERLGRDPLLYCNFFLNKEDFEARELRDAIRLLVRQYKYDSAMELLEKLKSYKAYKSRANLQFVKMIEAFVFADSCKEPIPEIEAKLLEALHITCPDFDEDKIKRYPLTLDEAGIINNLAGHYVDMEENDRAAKIYSALIDNLNSRYVDESEKARLYAAVMFNYSSCLGKSNRRREALDVIETAAAFERNRGRLLELPSFAGNKAYNLMMLGDMEVSLSYFALAYYGFVMFDKYEKNSSIQITQSIVKRNFGIDISH
ncbi:MAG: helix-turn-helix domain-containing protein [Oscillospiraceae bacterium]|nr:helix-turn-helix domain-containing protein [Oscillospiraceae bacterium]